MCTFTYFHIVQSDEKKISWMRSRLKIETFSPSNDLASEESIGLPAAPTIPGPSLSRLKVFLEEKGFKVPQSSDGLCRREYILVSKVVKLEEMVSSGYYSMHLGLMC
jgi:hypothetical protein